MKYATIKTVDIANGTGVRVSLFVSGCTHRCPECFNEIAWDFNYGQEFNQETIDLILKALEPSHIAGLTLLGGEPMELVNQEGLLPLLQQVRKMYPDKDIWCYTGYTFDKDVTENMFQNWPETKELMSYIDVVVDGKFEEDKKDLNLKFRGSSNQRIIDVNKSLKVHKVIPYDV